MKTQWNGNIYLTRSYDHATHNKYRLNKGFGYDTYTKLYHIGIVTILDYYSSV